MQSDSRLLYLRNPMEFAKGQCQSCSNRIEFPVESLGMTVECPHCNESTLLSTDPVELAEPTSGISSEELFSAFNGEITRTRVSILYQFGMLLAAAIMVLLPLIYLAMIAAAGWGIYYYGNRFSFLLHGGGGARLWLLKFVAYAGPLFIGTILVVFMIKPLFARRPQRTNSLALNPAVEKTLFGFIAKICQLVGAPMPNRIDLDCQLNAAAGFRRGALSFFGNDLVLTIGVPLAAGLNLREFAGVIAHEFGHFTQGFGMRLSYIIRSVNAWFARVVYERDGWDLALENAAEESGDWRIAIVVSCAQLAVWFSRILLHGLMLLGHGVCCFLLRHMEYDADTYEIKLAGSEAFETTARRMRVLEKSLGAAYKDMRVGWNSAKQLPDDFSAFMLTHDSKLSSAIREQIHDTLGLAKTGLFDTHPSDGDRIRRARLAQEPGIFHLELPATVLFADFETISKQVTQLHYSDDLGILVEPSMLKAARPAAQNIPRDLPPEAPATPGRIRLQIPPKPTA